MKKKTEKKPVGWYCWQNARGYIKNAAKRLDNDPLNNKVSYSDLTLVDVLSAVRDLESARDALEDLRDVRWPITKGDKNA